jgi:superoxide dismutase, Cu-Zn family
VCYVVAVLRGESRVTGEVQFEQASEGSPTKITYNISGMDPSSKRGFHVQYNNLRAFTQLTVSAFGDNTNGCISAGISSITL